MIQLIFISLIGLLDQVSPVNITSDWGYFEDYDYPNNPSQIPCTNNANSLIEAVIPFKGVFENIPQVILNPRIYDINKTSANWFFFSITSTTTTSFSIKIQCRLLVNSFSFKWIAIDDNRIKVINSFITNVNYAISKTYTFAHTNPNFVQGFVSALGISFHPSLSFSLSISTITTTQVSVLYTSDGYQNYQGFQVVLGTADAFIQSSLIFTDTITETNFYTSPTLTIPQGYLLAIPLFGLDVSLTLNDKVKVIFNETDTVTTIQYNYGTWSTSTCNSITHKYVWINTVPLPMTLKYFKVSPEYTQPMPSTLMELQITELNLSFSSIFSHDYVIQATQQTLNIIAYFQCFSGKKIQVLLLRQCIFCGSQYMDFTQNCNDKISAFTFYFQYYQKVPTDQNLHIEVTSNGFTLIQTITTSAGSYQTTIGTLLIVDI